MAASNPQLNWEKFMTRIGLTALWTTLWFLIVSAIINVAGGIDFSYGPNYHPVNPLLIWGLLWVFIVGMDAIRYLLKHGHRLYSFAWAVIFLIVAMAPLKDGWSYGNTVFGILGMIGLIYTVFELVESNGNKWYKKVHD